MLTIDTARKSLASELGLRPGPAESFDSGGTSGALDAERARASFETEKLTNLLDGSKEATARRRWIASSVEEYRPFVVQDVSRSDLIGEHVKHFAELHLKFVKSGFRPTPDDYRFMSETRVLNGPLGVHYSLFMNTLRSQASEEQQAVWVPKAMKLEIVGSYVQTELGKGSNVRGIRTTAEFDPRTDTFLVNTPTLQSMKFWPTGMVTSTHCVLYAQLLLEGKSMGVHVFFLQLRGPDFKPLPGIEIFDVGTKMGDNQACIGGLRIRNMRIPRGNLLAKRQYVTREGKYVVRRASSSVSPAAAAMASKLAYMTMLQTRVGMIGGAGNSLAEACTIAVRYSAVRRQGFRRPSAAETKFDSEEYQIIDYPIQRHRLIRRTSQAYALKVTGIRIRDFLSRMSAALESQEGSGGLGDATMLGELHATSAGLKAYATVVTQLGHEDLRQACGGLGYLYHSGIASIESNYKGPMLTAEGEPVPMLLQTARFLMKKYTAARRGEADAAKGLTSSFARFKDPSFDAFRDGRRGRDSGVVYDAGTPANTLAPLVTLFEWRSLCATQRAGTALDASMRRLGNADDAWVECHRSLHAAALAHVQYYTLMTFAEWVSSDSVARAGSGIATVLVRLCAYFGLSEISEGTGFAGLLTMEETDAANAALDDLSRRLRPDLVALVDAFDIPDQVLNSTLGRKDGNVYEAVYEAAKKSPLNMTPEGETILVPGYFEVLGKYLDREFLREGARTQRHDPSSSSSRM